MGNAYSHLKGLDFPVLLHRQVFANKDNSIGYLYLVSNSLNDSIDTINAIYQKRWKVELFHKTLKSTANIEKSFAHTIKTQSNHVFSSVYAVFKLECIAIKSHLNHFAIRAKLYSFAIKAVMKSYSELFSQFAPVSA